MKEHFDYLFFIDDDVASNYYHELILRDCDFIKEIRSFLYARKALEYFMQSTKQSNLLIPDVVFLDINMPEIDGFEFIEKFQNLDLDSIPTIIMMSTTPNPHHKKQAQENPLILEFVNKPLTLEYLEDLKNRI